MHVIHNCIFQENKNKKQQKLTCIRMACLNVIYLVFQHFLFFKLRVFFFQTTGAQSIKDFNSKYMAIDFITNLKEFKRIKEVRECLVCIHKIQKKNHCNNVQYIFKI